MENMSHNNLEKVLTVTIASDGLSFYCSIDKEAVPKGFFPVTEGGTPLSVLQGLISGEKLNMKNFTRAVAEIDTWKTVLLPNTVYEQGMEAGYMAVNNICCDPGEQIVVSPSFGVRAVMAAPGDIVEFLQDYWGDKLSFSSPIIQSIYRKKRGTVELNLTRGNVYITVIEDKLDYAEVFPYGNIADILYYMKQLGSNYDLGNCTTLVLGHQAEAVIRRLSNYYRSVIGNAHYQW